MYSRHFLPVPYAQKFSLFGSGEATSACTDACPRLFTAKAPLFSPLVPMFRWNIAHQRIACCVPSLSAEMPVTSRLSLTAVAWLKAPPGKVPRSTTLYLGKPCAQAIPTIRMLPATKLTTRFMFIRLHLE